MAVVSPLWSTAVWNVLDYGLVYPCNLLSPRHLNAISLFELRLCAPRVLVLVTPTRSRQSDMLSTQKLLRVFSIQVPPAETLREHLRVKKWRRLVLKSRPAVAAVPIDPSSPEHHFLATESIISHITRHRARKQPSPMPFWS